MQVPEFVKELVWTFYPPRYKQLSEQHFHKSLAFMSKMLLLAFLLTGILYLPKLFLLKSTINDELSRFDSFSISGDVKQTDVVMIPRTNPWIVIDMNSNLTLKKEFFVMDKESVQYRLLTVRKIPRDQLKDFASYKSTVSGFFTALIVLLIPGVALLLYVRAWLKYFFLILVFGSFFFVITELTKHRMRWKQSLNVAAHAVTPMILVETLTSFITTSVLIPINIRFLGLNFYAVTLLLFIAMMILAIAAYQVQARIEEKRKK